MKLERIGLLILCLGFCFVACNNDDGANDIPVVEVRDRTEQQIADKDSLKLFFESHYFNKSALVANNNPKMADIEIIELLENESIPDGYVLLSDELSLGDGMLETHTTTFAETEYEYYILKVNQGGGTKSPSFSDFIRVVYEGYTFNSDVNDVTQAFDSRVNPIDIDLVATMQGVFAWTKVFPFFNTAESFVDNGDGTSTYINGGVGVMFVPSGLSYYELSQTGIPAYTPVIFKFELLETQENDHDSDGIPSYLEDLDLDGLFTANQVDTTDEEDDDTDGDTFPNYFDNDDDNDGIPTADEIAELFEIKTYTAATKTEIESLNLASNEMLVNIKEESDGTFTGTTITSTDTDGDGILDYLDAD